MRAIPFVHSTAQPKSSSQLVLCNSATPMKQRYLEVTFRNGQPLAAYFYLPRKHGDISARTERHDRGLLIDFAPDGRAIGIEITAPASLSPEALNRALAAVDQQPATASELAPLAAA